MRIVQNGLRLEIRRTPGCMWLFGLWFVAGGVLAISMAFFARNANELEWWERLLVIGIGLGCAAGGLFVITQYPTVYAELDRSTGYGSVRYGGLFRRERTDFQLRDILAVAIEETTDSDGDLMYGLALRLRDGRTLRLLPQPIFGEEWATKHAEVLRGVLQLKEPVHRMRLSP